MQAYATFSEEGKPSGFYFEAVHGDKIPIEAIEISDEDYHAYVQEQGQWLRDPATGQRTVAPPPPPPTNEEIAASFVVAIEAHYDIVAQSKRYDNRSTCALRSGYTGPFQAEGQAFGIWMDTCNAYVYQVIEDCLAGTRTIPAVDELISELPIMVWPIKLE